MARAASTVPHIVQTRELLANSIASVFVLSPWSFVSAISPSDFSIASLIAVALSANWSPPLTIASRSPVAATLIDPSWTCRNLGSCSLICASRSLFPGITHWSESGVRPSMSLSTPPHAPSYCFLAIPLLVVWVPRRTTCLPLFCVIFKSLCKSLTSSMVGTRSCTMNSCVRLISFALKLETTALSSINERMVPNASPSFLPTVSFILCLPFIHGFTEVRFAMCFSFAYHRYDFRRGSHRRREAPTRSSRRARNHLIGSLGGDGFDAGRGFIRFVGIQHVQ